MSKYNNTRKFIYTIVILVMIMIFLLIINKEYFSFIVIRVFNNLDTILLILLAYAIQELIFGSDDKAVSSSYEDYLETHVDLCPFLKECETYANLKCHVIEHQKCETYLIKRNK